MVLVYISIYTLVYVLQKSRMYFGMVLLSSKLCHTFNAPIVLFSLFKVKNCVIMVFHDPLIVRFVFKFNFC